MNYNYEDLEKKTQFYPMSKKPPISEEEENNSVLVIVYEIDPENNILTDKDFGFYDFVSCQWRVLGGIDMELICWSYIPNPCEFVKDKNWKRILV